MVLERFWLQKLKKCSICVGFTKAFEHVVNVAFLLILPMVLSMGNLPDLAILEEFLEPQPNPKGFHKAFYKDFYKDFIAKTF